MRENIFEDRRKAGGQLAEALVKRGYRNHNVVVLGIPRGGVVVAEEVAETLCAPLDVIIARKLRAPHQPELGIGAVVNGDSITIINEDLVRVVGATEEYLNREITYQQEEIKRRLHFFREGRPGPKISGKTAIVIDDGIATGYTFRAALEGARRQNPAVLVAAAPVASRDSTNMLKAFADDVVCLITPVHFIAVGAWYQTFDQVDDEEVKATLSRNVSRFISQEHLSS